VLDELTANGTTPLSEALELSRAAHRKLSCVNDDGAVTVMAGLDALTLLLGEHFSERLKLYDRRKAHQLTALRESTNVQNAIVQFLKLVLSRGIKLGKDLNQDCASHKLHQVNGTYTYLTSKPIGFFTQENLDKAEKALTALKEETSELQATSPQTLWLQDLDALESAITPILEEREKSIIGEFRDKTGLVGTMARMGGVHPSSISTEKGLKIKSKADDVHDDSGSSRNKKEQRPGEEKNTAAGSSGSAGVRTWASSRAMLVKSRAAQAVEAATNKALNCAVTFAKRLPRLLLC
jgi:hypothetical protein